MKRIKLCYLAHGKSPHTIKWIRYFSENNYEVHLISFAKPDLQIKNIAFHQLGSKNQNPGNPFNYLYVAAHVKKIISKINPDIVHAHRIAGYGLLGAISKFDNIPFILSIWGDDVFVSPKKSILHYWFTKFILSKADYLFSTSEIMKKESEKYTTKTIYVTPFGVDTNKFSPIQKKGTGKGIIIGSIKKFYKKYGFEFLIKAIAILVYDWKIHNINLKLAGKGPEEKNLKKLVTELKLDQYVEFLGYLNEKEVPIVFKTFDIAVFPSIHAGESFGVAAVEAQACGVPVIVSNIGGLPESTKVNYSSILSEPSNEYSIADALAKLIDDKDLREKMGSNARKFVTDKYNISENFTHIENIYKSILKNE